MLRGPKACIAFGIRPKSGGGTGIKITHITVNAAEKRKGVETIRFNSFALSGLLDSNQRPRAPQTCALPTALNPELLLVSGCKGTMFF